MSSTDRDVYTVHGDDPVGEDFPVGSCEGWIGEYSSSYGG